MFTEMPELMKVVRESLEFLCQGPVTVSWVDNNIKEIENNYADRNPAYGIQYEIAKEKIYFFFDGSDKAELWFETINPLLGDVKPIEMVVIGKVDKLLDYINDQIGEDNT